MTESTNELKENEVNVNTEESNSLDEELLPSKKLGLISMILGLSSVSLFFFGDAVSLIVSVIPFVGGVLNQLISSFSVVIELGCAIAAIVLGCKSKKTIGHKMGKAGKILGIIMCVLVPVSLIISFILMIIGICFLLILMSLGFLTEILVVIAGIVEGYPVLAEALESIDWTYIIEVIESISPDLAELLKEYFPDLFGYLPQLFSVVKNFIC